MSSRLDSFKPTSNNSSRSRRDMSSNRFAAFDLSDDDTNTQTTRDRTPRQHHKPRTSRPSRDRKPRHPREHRKPREHTKPRAAPAPPTAPVPTRKPQRSDRKVVIPLTPPTHSQRVVKKAADNTIFAKILKRNKPSKPKDTHSFKPDAFPTLAEPSSTTHTTHTWRKSSEELAHMAAEAERIEQQRIADDKRARTLAIEQAQQARRLRLERQAIVDRVTNRPDYTTYHYEHTDHTPDHTTPTHDDGWTTVSYSKPTQHHDYSDDDDYYSDDDDDDYSDEDDYSDDDTEYDDGYRPPKAAIWASG